MRKQKSPKDTTEKVEAWLRIDAVMKHYRYSSVSAFARDVGLNRGENLYQIKRGNNGISKELADAITGKFPEISKAWLLTGEGFMAVSGDVTAVPFYYPHPVSLKYGIADRSIIVSSFLAHGGEFALAVNDNSLMPTYPMGTIAFLKQCDAAAGFIFGELYLVVTGQEYLYRVIRKSGSTGRLSLHPLNREQYDEIDIDLSEVIGVYKVCGLITPK